jgi:hypothetical protein
MQEKTFTGASLEQALKNDALTRPVVELVGMVKPSEKGRHVSFTRSGCDSWVDLSTDMIEQAELLDTNACKDHSHPVMRITLKEAEYPEGRVLAALLAQSMPSLSQVGAVTQVGPGSVPQTYPETQAQGAFGNYFPGAGPEGLDPGFIVPLPQTSALTSGLFGGVRPSGLPSTRSSRFICFGNVCACAGDDDCNGMFSTSCGGSYARCWIRGRGGANVFCLCSRR